MAENGGSGVGVPFMRWDEKVNIGNMPDYTSDVQQRYQEIINMVGTSNKKLTKKALQGLKDHYPWQEFVLKALTWVQKRSDELTRAISDHGWNGNVVELRLLLGGGIPSVAPSHQTRLVSHEPSIN